VLLLDEARGHHIAGLYDLPATGTIGPLIQANPKGRHGAERPALPPLFFPDHRFNRIPQGPGSDPDSVPGDRRFYHTIRMDADIRSPADAARDL